MLAKLISKSNFYFSNFNFAWWNFRFFNEQLGSDSKPKRFLFSQDFQKLKDVNAKLLSRQILFKSYKKTPNSSVSKREDFG